MDHLSDHRYMLYLGIRYRRKAQQNTLLLEALGV